MKRTTILLCTIALLFACGKQRPQYTLDGNTSKSNDTLYIYGVDNRHQQIDTIVTDTDGQFSYRLLTDTIVPLNIIMSDGTILPIYAEPNINGTLSSNGDEWNISGGALQTLHDSIVSRIESIDEKSQRHEAIDSFIKQHPYSDVNIYLLWHYFADTKEARGSLIRQRISLMGGTLQDNSHIADIKEAASSKQQNILHRSAPDFNLTDADGNTHLRSDYKDKYLLLSFWASWDSASVKYMRELKELSADTTLFKMINISLDYDTAAWMSAIKKDTLPGSHVCDRRMWESDIVKEFTIEKLPFEVLINPYMRVEKYNIASEWIISSVDSLTESYKDKLNKKSDKKKKIKSSTKKATQKEPQKNYNKESTKPRPRPGMNISDKDKKAEPLSEI